MVLYGSVCFLLNSIFSMVGINVICYDLNIFMQEFINNFDGMILAFVM